MKNSCHICYNMPSFMWAVTNWFSLSVIFSSLMFCIEEVCLLLHLFCLNQLLPTISLKRIRLKITLFIYKHKWEIRFSYCRDYSLCISVIYSCSCYYPALIRKIILSDQILDLKIYPCVHPPTNFSPLLILKVWFK